MMKFFIISLVFLVCLISYRFFNTDPNSKIVDSARVYVEQKGFSLEDMDLLIDTNNHSWDMMNGFLENSPREGLHQILPEGLTEADLQVVKLTPKVEHSVSTILIFVNKNNYETLGSLGEQ